MRLRRPVKPRLEGRTEAPVLAIAFGRQVIASGAVVWRQVLCKPRLRHVGAVAWPDSIDKLRLRLPRKPLWGGRTEKPILAMAIGKVGG